MTLRHEIVTDPLAPQDLWSDLRTNLRRLEALAQHHVLLFFGFAWGKHLYTGAWMERETATREVEAQVLAAERSGYGRLGHDNLYLTVAALGFRLQYSHETDIHLSYASENAFVAEVLARWRANQWLMEGGRQR
jgi:hypothetical protein